MNKNILQNPLIKGALIILLTSLTGIFANMPENPHKWTIFWLTTVGTILVYLGQSILLPSNSTDNAINLRDVLKGLILSVGNGIINYFATNSNDEKIDWNKLVMAMVVMFSGYLLKQWQTPAPKTLS